MTKYVHVEEEHNLESPNEIVPVIMNLLKPKSVVDIGCGIGTFLHVFKLHQVENILGLDGEWVNKKLLGKYISEDEFRQCNLEEEVNLDKKYDLAISLEVAEHLSADAAKLFVRNLVNAGEVVIFSAAIPLQGGQNHINEQWLTFWESLFLEHGYYLHDVFRPIIWDNPNIFWWYKQNMVLFGPKHIKFKTDVSYCPMRNIIHPENFTLRAERAISVDDPNLPTVMKTLLRFAIGSKNIKKLKAKFSS